MPTRIQRLGLLIAAFVLGVTTSLIYERRVHPRLTTTTLTTSATAHGTITVTSIKNSPSSSLVHHQDRHQGHDENQVQGQNRIHAAHNVNAAFVVLLQNKDLHDMRKTMRMLESTFNHRYQYPYIFLNDAPFTEHFKTHIQAMTQAPCLFGNDERRVSALWTENGDF
jgi:hypothetical protein